MRPLAEFPLGARRAVRGVLADIDDTLTTDGRLTAGAYGAMERLHDAGLMVIPITGRPAGWCDHIARMWPVDALVGENGAFWFLHDAATRTMQRCFAQDAAERAANRQRLATVRDRILREVPGAAVASDQRYREVDLAIDFCEDVPRLPDAAVERIAALMREAGLNAKVSSIHVNGWFGTHDKLSMTRRLFADAFGVDLDRDQLQYVFVGDSPNDAPMFGHFGHSVGVANVRDFAGRLPAEPAWITRERAGAGFVELAEALLAARGA